MEIVNIHKPTTALGNYKLTLLELGDWICCNFSLQIFAIALLVRNLSSEMKAEVLVLKLDSAIESHTIPNIVSFPGK